MKKFLKALAVLAAVAALGYGFASCFSSDDDSGSSDGYDFHVKNLVITQTEGKNELVFKWDWDSEIGEKYANTAISLSTGASSWSMIGIVKNGARTYTWDIDSFDNDYVKNNYIKEGTLTFNIEPSYYDKEKKENFSCNQLEASVHYVPVSK
ncbi:hypothetical protein [uncultured Treponema sp.]|uniref:hypothetical protein n=1 Tax=uncultured Treponema sp. TaxID=162155 RepID=UPI0025FA97E1|nr:hypothetical protein [uncultured Treponema sp.]